MINIEKPYDENKINWQKSVSEVSRFLLDHSENGFFVEQNEFESKGEQEKVKRLKNRLAELLEKATKRLGYQVDDQKLINDAYRQIIKMNDSGELPPSGLLKNFCAEIEERLEKVA
ncbi:MAG: hypothetical protein WC564_00795 [Patescibacteria group bacterium]|jgi:hypothetical protein